MKIIKNTKIHLKKSLYIVATPIGNLNDISNRSINILKEVDFIVCENPNHSIKLLNNLGIKKKLLSLHDYNEKNVINHISKYNNNSKIALISDAGSPLISDPGYNLVKYFIEQNYFVTSIPGPTSIICALQLSGIPINNFAYFGFVPKQNTKMELFFKKINDINLTSIFFVSAKNLEKTIKNIIEIIGEREIAVSKEISKFNENVFRGSTKSIYQQIKKQMIVLKGEFTIVLSGITKKNKKSVNNEIKKELIKLLKKYSLTETVTIVHNLSGISRNEVYRTALKFKND